jgi:hypothetical protein
MNPWSLRNNIENRRLAVNPCKDRNLLLGSQIFEGEVHATFEEDQ